MLYIPIRTSAELHFNSSAGRLRLFGCAGQEHTHTRIHSEAGGTTEGLSESFRQQWSARGFGNITIWFTIGKWYLWSYVNRSYTAVLYS
jgi:hypothetical protein